MHIECFLFQSSVEPCDLVHLVMEFLAGSKVNDTPDFMLLGMDGGSVAALALPVVDDSDENSGLRGYLQKKAGGGRVHSIDWIDFFSTHQYLFSAANIEHYSADGVVRQTLSRDIGLLNSYSDVDEVAEFSDLPPARDVFGHFQYARSAVVGSDDSDEKDDDADMTPVHIPFIRPLRPHLSEGGSSLGASPSRRPSEDLPEGPPDWSGHVFAGFCGGCGLLLLDCCCYASTQPDLT